MIWVNLKITTLATLEVAWVGANVFFLLPVQKLRLEDGKSVVHSPRLNTQRDHEWPHIYLTLKLMTFSLFFCAEVTGSVLPPSCVSSQVLPTMLAGSTKGSNTLLVVSTHPSDLLSQVMNDMSLEGGRGQPSGENLDPEQMMVKLQ